MSIDISKTGYGVIVAAESSAGIVVSKVGYGVIVDTLTIPPANSGNFLPFLSAS